MHIADRSSPWFFLLAWLVAVASGCEGPAAIPPRPGGGPAAGTSAAGREVLVFAAASTTEALDAACAAFQGETGISVTTSYASSSALAQQILHGAQADLFVSANASWADEVAAAGLVAERVDWLGNRLVVIAPADSQLALQTPADLRDGAIARLAVADPAAVPAGIYARRVLEREGLWSAVEPKVVAGADVRQTLAYVEQGAAEAGIVYATDAALTPRVKVLIELPALADDPIVYPLVLLKTDSDAARTLFAYLQTPAATAIFQRYGFTIHTEK